MEWRSGRRGVRSSALRLVQLFDPLDHVFGGQPLELISVSRDLARQRLGFAVNSPAQPSLRVAPR